MTEELRTGARQLIASAVEAELFGYLQQFAVLKDGKGRQQVVRNGYLPEREIQTGIGPVTVRVPKVRDKRGQRAKFNSRLLPPYIRKTKSIEETLPWLYLKGVSTGDFQETLQALLGRDAKGLSTATISVVVSACGKKSTTPGLGGGWRTSGMSISGPMACTSTSAAMAPSNAFLLWLESLSKVGRNVSPLKTGIGNLNKVGRKCCYGSKDKDSDMPQN